MFCHLELDPFESTPPPTPSSLLGVGTTVESLQSSVSYAQTAENVLSPLAKDLALEDAMLQKHIKKGRLEIWWKGVADAARKSLRDDGDRKGEEVWHRRSVEEGFWNAVSKRDSEALRTRAEEKARVGAEGKGVISGGSKKEASVSMDKQTEARPEGHRKVNGEGQREVNGVIDVEMGSNG